MSIIIDHPFFYECFKAFESQSGKMFDGKALDEFRESTCKLYTPKMLQIRWPRWEIGLPRPTSLIGDAHAKYLLEGATSLLKDFFKRVQNGHLYADYSTIEEKFGEGIESRIGKSSGLHFNLEAAYWTFNIKFNNWIGHNRKEYDCSLVCDFDEFLARFDDYLRNAFFPTPGPYDVGPKLRKEAQDILLNEFAPNIREALMKDISEMLPKELPKELKDYCYEKIYLLAKEYEATLSSREEYESGFLKVMGHLNVPIVEWPKMLETITVHCEGQLGIHYHKLSPLNQFLVATSPYIWYCLEKNPPKNFKPKELERFSKSEEFNQYLNQISREISQKVKGALWKPEAGCLGRAAMFIVLSVIIFLGIILALDF